MNRLCFLIAFLVVLFSCTNNDVIIPGDAAAADSKLELNEAEAKELLSDFIVSNPETKGIDGFEVVSAKSFYIALPEKESGKVTTVGTDSIRLYEFITKTDESTGFAIVVGDERIRKVLIQVEQGALSDTSFIPPLKEYYNSIPYFVANDLERYAAKAIDTSLKTKTEENYPIVTTYSCFVPTLWGQSYPENAACPTVCPVHGTSSCLATAKLNGRCLAGCVPIAMAQIMAYHRKPSSLNWNSILASPLLTSVSQQAINQASTLIANLGSAVYASYGCTGTSASNYQVPSVFSAYGYSHSGLVVFTVSTVKQSIFANRPVLVFGRTSNRDGHAWVCDAYKTHDYGYGDVYEYLHMNWGWRGSCNGFYYIDTTLYFNTGQYNFNTSLEVIANIR